MTKQSDSIVVYTYFNRPPSSHLKFEDASLTRQEFVKDADLNNIMKRYASGLPPSPAGSRPPMFGDFSNIPDYQTSLQVVIDAQAKFADLPSAVRKRFDNDPGKLIEFLQDASNRDEAVRLGLITKSVSTSVSTSVESKEGQSPEGAE